MSDTVLPAAIPPTPEPQPNVQVSAGAVWGRPILSLFVAGITLGAFIFNSMVTKNDTVTTTLTTAFAVNFTTVVQWWFGSSHSSQQKDATIATIAAQQKVSTP